MKLSSISLMMMLMMTSAYANETTTAKTEPTLDDAQIAGVVKTANEGEVDIGKQAQKNAKRPEVKDFAEQMVQHHSQANKEDKELLSKLKISPKKSDLSESLERTAKSESRKLKEAKKGDAFDRAYIESQIKLHQTVLSSLDNTLIPDAKNAQLKSQLEKTREVVAHHLSEAKAIQAAF